METQLQYKLPVFEGPLDLLLTLISKNKIDFYDISIVDLLDQYMERRGSSISSRSCCFPSTRKKPRS